MYIDLTVTLNNQTPVYPGDPAVSITPGGKIELDGYSDHLLSLGTHVGTHIDAPAHMIAGGKTLNQFPIERFIGRGVVIDAIKQYDLALVQQSGIKPGDIVLFHTGLIKKYNDPDYYTDFPALPEEIAHFLIEHKISMVGIDASGPDHEPFPIHKLLLGAEIPIIENLTNLDTLKGEFEIIALPLNLEIDGSPARVIAKV